MNRYPAKPIMDEMAKYGRYGDTMLVHMNPVEVAGIASLVPGGKLTTNPVTGQPEAFLPLLFGALGGAMGLTTLGTAALTGIGTAAITGDLKRGLLAGVTSGLAAPIGEGIGDLLSGADTATQAVTQAVDSGGDIMEAIGAGEASTSAIAAAGEAGVGAGADTLNALSMPYDAALTGAATPTSPGLTVGDVEQLAAAPTKMGTAPSQGFFGGAENAVNAGIAKLGTSGQLVGAMTAEGASQQMQAQQDFERQQRAMREESEAKRRQAYEDLQGAYSMAQPGAQGGYSPYRSMMSRNTLPPMYAAQGGVVRMQTGSVVPTEEESRVLGIAGRGDILGAENQAILEGYYNRLAQANQASQEAAAAASDAENTLFIEEGATNREALDALYNAGLVPPETYGWFQDWFAADNGRAGQSQYFASPNFPGVEEWLKTVDFDEANQQRIRDILPKIQQAAKEGIKYSDLPAVTGGNPFAYAGVGTAGFNFATQPGYGGLDPVTIQANLRGKAAVTPPADYMTGFEPEFSYFQEDPDNPFIPTRRYRPTARRFFNEADYFDPILDREAYLQQISDYYTKLGGYMPEDVFYPEVPDTTPDDTDTTGGGNGVPPVTPEEGETITRDEINALYQELFGRDALDAGANYWISEVVSGNVSKDRLREALIAGAQGSDREYYEQNVLGQDGGGTGGGAEGGETGGGLVSRSQIDALYQELFGRNAQDAGAKYWMDEVNSGNIAVDDLREALIAGAQGSDREYYEKNVLGQGGDTTTTDTTDTTTTDTTTTTGAGASGFVGAASLREVDPYAWSKRTFFSGVNVDPSSKETLTAEEFQKIIAGQQGKYGEGSKMTYDPSVGAIYSTVPEGMEDEFGDRAGVPFYADPRTLSDVQRIRFNHMSGGTRSRSFKEGDKIYKIPAQQQALRIGNKQYLVNPDGSVTAYSVEDVKYDSTPRFLGMNEGGTVPLRSSMGNAEVSAGGIANVPTEFMASMPTEQEFNMVAAAVLGRLENADAIVDMFVRKYGPEMFQQIRNMVLRSVAPEAQTEGMVRGQGSGMEDKIPGMIGDQQPVAVSPGEFIVPADVVSGLGDGSSDAGAEKLDQMMDRVRMARGGNTKQAPSIDADRMMPA